MIRGQLWEILDEGNLRRLDEAAVQLLTRTGALIEHEAILKKLTDAGCKVDRDSGRCLFTEKLIRTVLKHFGGGKVETEYRGPGRFDPDWQSRQYGSFPQFLEWPECRCRLATKDDVRNMAKMGHVLPEFIEVGQALTCSEVDTRVEPLWNAVERMSITDKPVGGGEVIYPQHVQYLARLSEIATGEAGNISMLPACNYSVAPMIFGRRDLECIIEKAKYRVPHMPGTMPIGGISAPVTIAGTAALCLAEIIAGWVIGYLLDPSLSAAGIVGAGSLDMRTLHTLFGAPEARLANIAVHHVGERLYGIKMHICMDYIDRKRPGIQATFEKTMLMAVWPFIGSAWFRVGGGLLQGGKAYSPVQHLLDIEMRKCWERFAAGFDVNDVTLAVDLVDSVARRRGATFLDTDHTLEHYASEQWYPRWFDRRAWQGDAVEEASERKMLEEIDRYWKDAVARYQRPELDEKKLAEARQVLQNAEREMKNVSLAV